MSGMWQWAIPGLKGGYHLADANDFSGNSKTLTNNGGVTFGLGKFGNCAILGSSNTSKYFSRTDGLGIDLSGACGVSAWIYPQANPASGKDMRLVHWMSTTGTGRALVVGYKNNAGTYGIIVNAGGTDIFATCPLTLGKWHKLDVSINAGGNCYIYINGAIIGSGSRGSTSNATNKFLLGSETNLTSGYFWSGNIDEALMFSVHRTSQEIRRAYAFQRGML